MSEHTADVVKIDQIFKHNNADKLEIVKVFDYQCVVRKGDFKPGDLGVFFHPETILDTSMSEFSFLEPQAKADGKVRIRIVRLRQEKSYGLLIPAPVSAKAGDNLWDFYKCEWYEPKASGPKNNIINGSTCKPPKVQASVPDPQNIRKYNSYLDGEEVFYTTKLHGSFFRATYQDGELFVGSKNHWRYKPGTQVAVKKYQSLSLFRKIINFFTKKVKKYIIAPESSWWTAANQHPWIEEFLIKNPGYTIMGEMVGSGIQKGFDYGFKPGELGVYIFAVSNGYDFVDSNSFHFDSQLDSLVKVPVLYYGVHNYEKMKSLAEEKESLNDCGHIREGVVATTYNDFGRRIVLKYVSDQYLEGT